MPSSDESERLNRLRAIPLFSHLSDASLRGVLECTNEFEAPENHVLVQPNEAGAGLFIIDQGTVVVETSQRKIELGAGEFFGELALLVDVKHIARVRTKSRVRCVALHRDDFNRLLQSEPTMAVSMLRVVARRLVEASHP
jgi:voltage-gated potassium channel